jgi:hypothetical protein
MHVISPQSEANTSETSHGYFSCTTAVQLLLSAAQQQQYIKQDFDLMALEVLNGFLKTIWVASAQSTQQQAPTGDRSELLTATPGIASTNSASKLRPS